MDLGRREVTKFHLAMEGGQPRMQISERPAPATVHVLVALRDHGGTNGSAALAPRIVDRSGQR